MPKYKPGDRVLVKKAEDLEWGSRDFKEYNHLIGTVVTIANDTAHLDKYDYLIEELPGSLWGDCEFVGLVDEEESKLITNHEWIRFGMEVEDLAKILNCSCCVNYPDKCNGDEDAAVCINGTIEWLKRGRKNETSV
jgi:hypothetical protein